MTATADLQTCALCPKLCRWACPVATTTSREAAVPSQLAAAVLWHPEGMAATSLCVTCGRCQSACHLDRPLHDWLAEVRSHARAVEEPDGLQDPTGTARDVAVESDGREWAGPLSSRLGRPVATVRTRDALGSAAYGTRAWTHHAKRLVAHLSGRTVWVCDGRVASALRRAGVAFRWVDEALDDAAHGCQSGALGQVLCCGGGAPLCDDEPDLASAMAERFAQTLDGRTLRDGRCRRHLRACGYTTAVDAVDRLLAEVEVQETA